MLLMVLLMMMIFSLEIADLSDRYIYYRCWWFSLFCLNDKINKSLLPRWKKTGKRGLRDKRSIAKPKLVENFAQNNDFSNVVTHERAGRFNGWVDVKIGRQHDRRRRRRRRTEEEEQQQDRNERDETNERYHAKGTGGRGWDTRKSSFRFEYLLFILLLSLLYFLF